MTTRAEILKMLSDGVFHSGTDLGNNLGITRAAVCKCIRRLTQSGLDVHRVTGRGYRLDAPLTLLDRSRILKHLGAAAPLLKNRLEILDQVDSTNRYLRARAAEEQKDTRDLAASLHGSVCLTEAQSQGRGRRGRAWVTTPYHNLTLSMAWRFPSGPAFASGLSLAAGVAVLHAIEEYGVEGGGLKWPNDVLWKGRKLAGLLADVAGEAAGPCVAVLGVGINCFIHEREAARIDQPWADLQTITGAPVDRNRLAALVIRHLRAVLEDFADSGLAPYRGEWERRHLYAGRKVRLLQGEATHEGIAEGVDEHGALCVRDARGAVRKFHSGEISLRPV